MFALSIIFVCHGSQEEDHSNSRKFRSLSNTEYRYSNLERKLRNMKLALFQRMNVENSQGSDEHKEELEKINDRLDKLQRDLNANNELLNKIDQELRNLENKSGEKDSQFNQKMPDLQANTTKPRHGTMRPFRIEDVRS